MDGTNKASSSSASSSSSSAALVLVEKRAKRNSGGCVDILFQLFDWNRKFAKKKLFSGRLLPWIRRKPIRDGRLPASKLMMAEENNGGFPSLRRTGFHCVESEKKKSKQGDMSDAGLVFRLMGLDSMPLKKKLPLPLPLPPVEPSTCQAEVVMIKQSLNMATPPTEAFHLRHVLSHSRRHHRKVPFSMRTPRISSRRLLRILDPALHPKPRARRALTYTKDDDAGESERSEFENHEPETHDPPLKKKHLCRNRDRQKYCTSSRRSSSDKLGNPKRLRRPSKEAWKPPPVFRNFHETERGEELNGEEQENQQNLLLDCIIDFLEGFTLSSKHVWKLLDIVEDDDDDDDVEWASFNSLVLQIVSEIHCHILRVLVDEMATELCT